MMNRGESRFWRLLHKLGSLITQLKWVIVSAAMIISAIWTGYSAAKEGLGQTATAVAQLVAAAATVLIVQGAVYIAGKVTEILRRQLNDNVSNAQKTQRHVVDLGEAKDNIVLDLKEGDYFRVKLVGNSSITITNPPQPGEVGKFDLEITGFGYGWGVPVAFKFDSGMPSLSYEGTDFISGTTSDGGVTWYITTKLAETWGTSLVPAKDIQPTRESGCYLVGTEPYERTTTSVGLRFHPAIEQSAEWVTTFPTIQGKVRFRFSIDPPHSSLYPSSFKDDTLCTGTPKAKGKYFAVFKISGPNSTYMPKNKTVRVKAGIEVVDPDKPIISTCRCGWSEFTDIEYVGPGENYSFHIERDVSDPEDTLGMAINIYAIKMEYVVKSPKL